MSLYSFASSISARADELGVIEPGGLQTFLGTRVQLQSSCKVVVDPLRQVIVIIYKRNQSIRGLTCLLIQAGSKFVDLIT